MSHSGLAQQNMELVVLEGNEVVIQLHGASSSLFQQAKFHSYLSQQWDDACFDQQESCVDILLQNGERLECLPIKDALKMYLMAPQGIELTLDDETSPFHQLRQIIQDNWQSFSRIASAVFNEILNEAINQPSERERGIWIFPERHPYDFPSVSFDAVESRYYDLTTDGTAQFHDFEIGMVEVAVSLDVLDQDNATTETAREQKRSRTMAIKKENARQARLTEAWGGLRRNRAPEEVRRANGQERRRKLEASGVLVEDSNGKLQLNGDPKPALAA